MLYDAAQGPRDPNDRSCFKRVKDNGDTQSEPTPITDTRHDKDEMGGNRDGELEVAPEPTTDKAHHKNMFRAFDGTALITIGEKL